MIVELCLLLNLVILKYCAAVPLAGQEAQMDPEDYMEDEIIPNDLSKTVITYETLRWPNNIVYFRLDPKLTSLQRDLIYTAMYTISSRSYVRFVEASAYRFDYVSFNLMPEGSGCSSNVGYLGQPQSINLADGAKCFAKGVLIHEILHTCGFWHQHSDPTRDDYITIRWENVMEGKEYTFAKRTPEEATSLGISYDCESIMHYGVKAFSSNGLDTIEAKDASCIGMGQREKMSDKDLMKLRMMYPPISG